MFSVIEFLYNLLNTYTIKKKKEGLDMLGEVIDTRSAGEIKTILTELYREQVVRIVGVLTRELTEEDESPTIDRNYELMEMYCSLFLLYGKKLKYVQVDESVNLSYSPEKINQIFNEFNSNNLQDLNIVSAYVNLYIQEYATFDELEVLIHLFHQKVGLKL